MRKIIYSCFIILLCGSAVFAGNNKLKADTVNGWQVTYDGKEILGYNLNGINTYLIDSIADKGVITVDFYTDYPCAKCKAQLQFRDGYGKVLAAVGKDGVGDGPPFRLPGMQFRELMHDHKLYLFYRNQVDGWSSWLFIGVVQTKK